MSHTSPCLSGNRLLTSSGSKQTQKMPPHNHPGSPVTGLQRGQAEVGRPSVPVQVFFPPGAPLPMGVPIAVAIPGGGDACVPGYPAVYSPAGSGCQFTPPTLPALPQEPFTAPGLTVSVYQEKGTTYYVRRVSQSSPALSLAGVSPPMSVTDEPTRPAPVYSPARTAIPVTTSPVIPAGDYQALNTTVNGRSVTTQLEIVWHGEFNHRFRHFAQYGHNWDLVPRVARGATPLREEGFSLFRDSAKVRFSCSKCGKGWTSMKGRVQFWYRLSETGQGEVVFSLYGQQCSKCKGVFEHAMWYPEEVVKVIENVFHRVGQALYNFPKPIIRVDRRQGKPKEQHDSSLCQACQDGVCQEEWSAV